MPSRSQITPTEHQIQAAFVKWCKLAEPKYPKLRCGFAVPNGGHRNKITAALLKAEGVKKGVLDWWLPVKNAHFCGLVIEFKRKGGHVTPEQREMIDFLRAEGRFVEVCYSTEEAIVMVQRYFK